VGSLPWTTDRVVNCLKRLEKVGVSLISLAENLFHPCHEGIKLRLVNALARKIKKKGLPFLGVSKLLTAKKQTKKRKREAVLKTGPRTSTPLSTGSSEERKKGGKNKNSKNS